MRKDKSEALKLRSRGKSYNQISRLLGVPKSTLSGWFSGLELSSKIREKINARGRRKSVAALIRRNQQQTKIARRRARETVDSSALEISRFSQNNLLLLGAVLYWAEGYKRSVIRNGRTVTYHVVSLTNSDPWLIKLFLRFLREVCDVPEKKIKANLRIFKHQSESKIRLFWQKETKILKENFGKTYRGISISSAGKKPFNRLEYGVIQIVVADTKLFYKIMGYIEGIKKFV